VEGQGEWLGGRAIQPQGDPSPKLLGCFPAEREDEDAVGIKPAAGYPVDHGLDDRRRLPCAGSGQDQQRTAGMADDLRLGGVEIRCRGGVDRPSNQAVCGRLPIHVVSIPASGTDTCRGLRHTGVSQSSPIQENLWRTIP
jgi:hypothetical protein